MSLLEPEEENQTNDVGFDEKSKVRLFETQRRESTGSFNYLKKFLPVVLIAIVILGGIIWLMQPGSGDAVRPPSEIEQAVDDYMLSKEHRSIREITFFKCDGFYWVRILAEPRSSLASVDDPSNQYRLTAKKQDDGSIGIDTLPLPPKEHDVPCLWKKENG